MEKINQDLIAPCGMNCAICMAHLRKNNPCHGCNNADCNKPKTRVNCKIRNCQLREGKFCFDCPKFPCDRLKHLDSRYRQKYGMSEIENLNKIKTEGMEKFLESEQQKWRCPNCGQLRCCHNGLCYHCDIKK